MCGKKVDNQTDDYEWNEKWKFFHIIFFSQMKTTFLIYQKIQIQNSSFFCGYFYIHSNECLFCVVIVITHTQKNRIRIRMILFFVVKHSILSIWNSYFFETFCFQIKRKIVPQSRTTKSMWNEFKIKQKTTNERTNEKKENSTRKYNFAICWMLTLMMISKSNSSHGLQLHKQQQQQQQKHIPSSSSSLSTSSSMNVSK